MRLTVLDGTVLLAVAAAAAASCGVDNGPEIVGPCVKVFCENSSEFLRCDPSDGVCKCGPFEGNLICGPAEVCTPQGGDTFVCRNARCDGVTCSQGETCNPPTGECACGTGPDAKKCDERQTCEN